MHCRIPALLIDGSIDADIARVYRICLDCRQDACIRVDLGYEYVRQGILVKIIRVDFRFQ
jgi:hypothetical protein